MTKNPGRRGGPLASTAAGVLLLLSLSGCAGQTSPAYDAVAVSSLPASPASGHTGSHGEAPPSNNAPAGEGPSDAALMVCGDQPKDRLSAILDLEAHPHAVDDWADRTYTCTYHLDEGALVISVKEARDQAAALADFEALQASASEAAPIKGLASLGFPAYETAAGSAVFQKDNFVLQVNAAELPATLGPDNITRNALAYQLSTTILACWIEHP